MTYGDWKSPTLAEAIQHLLDYRDKNAARYSNDSFRDDEAFVKHVRELMAEVNAPGIRMKERETAA